MSLISWHTLGPHETVQFQEETLNVSTDTSIDRNDCLYQQISSQKKYAWLRQRFPQMARKLKTFVLPAYEGKFSSYLVTDYARAYPNDRLPREQLPLMQVKMMTLSELEWALSEVGAQDLLRKESDSKLKQSQWIIPDAVSSNGIVYPRSMHLPQSTSFPRPLESWGVLEDGVMACCGQLLNKSNGCWIDLEKNDRDWGIVKPYRVWYNTPNFRVSVEEKNVQEIQRLIRETIQTGTAFKDAVHFKKLDTQIRTLVQDLALYIAEIITSDPAMDDPLSYLETKNQLDNLLRLTQLVTEYNWPQHPCALMPVSVDDAVEIVFKMRPLLKKMPAPEQRQKQKATEKRKNVKKMPAPEQSVPKAEQRQKQKTSEKRQQEQTTAADAEEKRERQMVLDAVAKLNGKAIDPNDITNLIQILSQTNVPLYRGAAEYLQNFLQVYNVFLQDSAFYDRIQQLLAKQELLTEEFKEKFKIDANSIEEAFIALENFEIFETILLESLEKVQTILLKNDASGKVERLSLDYLDLEKWWEANTLTIESIEAALAYQNAGKNATLDPLENDPAPFARWQNDYNNVRVQENAVALRKELTAEGLNLAGLDQLILDFTNARQVLLETAKSRTRFNTLEEQSVDAKTMADADSNELLSNAADKLADARANLEAKRLQLENDLQQFRLEREQRKAEEARQQRVREADERDVPAPSAPEATPPASPRTPESPSPSAPPFNPQTSPRGGNLVSVLPPEIPLDMYFKGSTSEFKEAVRNLPEFPTQKQVLDVVQSFRRVVPTVNHFIPEGPSSLWEEYLQGYGREMESLVVEQRGQDFLDEGGIRLQAFIFAIVTKDDPTPTVVEERRKALAISQ